MLSYDQHISDPKLLKKVAADMIKEANRLKRQAQENERIIRRRLEWQKTLKQFPSLPSMVRKKMSDLKVDHTTAQFKVSIQLGIPIETVQHFEKEEIKKETLAKRQRKQSLVMKLYRNGFKNAEISLRTGYHPNSVSRIISQTLKGPD